MCTCVLKYVGVSLLLVCVLKRSIYTSMCIRMCACTVLYVQHVLTTTCGSYALWCSYLLSTAGTWILCTREAPTQSKSLCGPHLCCISSLQYSLSACCMHYNTYKTLIRCLFIHLHNICIHFCLGVFTFSHVNIRMSTHVHTSVHTNIDPCVHTTHACMPIYRYTLYICMYVCMHSV